MHDPLLLADKAFFVTFTEVRVKFIIAVETFLTEITHRMGVNIRLLLLLFLMQVSSERRHVDRELTGSIGGMFMREDPLVANA